MSLLAMMPPLPNQLLSTRRHALNYWPRNSSWWTSRKACDLKLFRIACVLENHCEYLDRRHRLDRIEIASIGVSRRRPRRGARRAHVWPFRVSRRFASRGSSRATAPTCRRTAPGARYTIPRSQRSRSAKPPPYGLTVAAWLPETGAQRRGGVALITHGQTAKPPRPESGLSTSAACR
jgi:hypothetical protein